MASHQRVDTTSPSPGQAIRQESGIGRHGFKKSSPSERSYKPAEGDSKRGQHTVCTGEAVPKEQEASMASHGMAKLLAVLDQEMLQEIMEWPQRSRRHLEQERSTKSVSLSDEASTPWLPIQQAPCERPNFLPEWQEIDDTVKSVRRILHNPAYENDARLSSEDELAVRKLLKYHPRSKEERG